MGTPAASDLPLAPGAGHGGEGDASLQGPAQEAELPVLPKPTNAEATTEASSIIELVPRFAKPETDETARETNGLVTMRPKPEKRLNAQQRAKARREKDKPEAAEVVAATPEVGGLATAHPKPEKRKNAKERAMEKFAKAKPEDGTRPMTATAKSKGEAKVEGKKVKKGKAA